MDNTVIELGGNITLNGFSHRDYAELIVIKKITGRYARQISDHYGSFHNLALTLTTKDSQFIIDCQLTIKDKHHELKIINSNLFVALDSALKQLLQQL